MSATIQWSVTGKQIADNTIQSAHWQCEGTYNGDSHVMVGQTTVAYEATPDLPEEWQKYTAYVAADQATDAQVLQMIWDCGVDKDAAEQFINDQLGAS